MKLRQILFVRPAPLARAEQAGAFAREGLEVETTQTLSSDQLGQGLADGTWDIGIGVMDNVIAWNAERKADLVMLAQLERSTVMTFCSSLPTLQEASRAPIAVDATTNGFVLVLYRALARAGIDWGRCTYDMVGGVKHRFDALMEGRGRSAILIPPFDGLAQAKGFHALWHSSEVSPAYPGQVVCARAGYIGKNPQPMQRYLRALLRANRSAPGPEAVPDLRLSMDGWKEVVALRNECGLMPSPEPSAQTIIDEQPLLAALKSLDAQADAR